MDQQPITPVPAPVPPLMAWREFADWIRVDQNIVRGWCENGHIPTVRIGKHRLVNVALLSHSCLEQEEF
ncbi:helix-turn-helix domain-containing protein [Marinobacterium sp. D7]|uniref:helix-turn-helix domain-containing protein n=1 Tax=Marinobacterium ramblicola TaxID=2849041 RepID=UPI001C2CD804|nr:helix-turn-helix domain-containing protein [Marinobacterium ramblicola]MBV1789018.1 helix-turn-helix domain-containing protein [Marinobacterium ramblicola]